jgi:nucleoside-diphosphate-sugar epimerase
MKVLVTGHKGYIGAHLVPLLKEARHFVTGCDLDLFRGCEWGKVTPPDEEWIQDIRLLSKEDLSHFDCIIHLAAISNDPMGEIDPEITYQINQEGSIHLAKMAKDAKVKRFLFSGSCSIYGQGQTLDLDETAKFNPQSAYAKSKVEAELGILSLADANFCVSSLRNATAYGDSPMLRLDLVVNNLLACAFTRGDIRIMSDGTPWRPLIHAKDIARAFLAFMQAPAEKVNGKAVNIGANSENYQVKDVGEKVQKLIPHAKIVYTEEVGNDPRNYRVNFNLLHKLLPDFKLEYTLEKGMNELYRSFCDTKLSVADFSEGKYIRLAALKNRYNLATL